MRKREDNREKIGVAVLGYGTVGSGVAEVIRTNQAWVNKKAGKEVELRYILDLRDFPGDIYEEIIIHNIDTIIEDERVQVICEVIGGIEPALEYTRRALSAGKSVCTSNKELVAQHGAELLALARENDCNYLFEASVGGGIPVIRPLNTSLTSEKIGQIAGILNGTTNYILTKMQTQGVDFAEVLKEAQQKGYAERNPEADVEGHDACRKLAILASLAYGKSVDYREIHTEGITDISMIDFLYAQKVQSTIKLLGRCTEIEGKYYAVVAPFLVHETNPLYGVNGVFNAIMMEGNTLGKTMYYGQGAGKLPTASAVVSDVIDCAKHNGINMYCFWDEEKLGLSDLGEIERNFLVRIKGKDLARIEKAFGKVEVIEAGVADEIGFLTPTMKEGEFDKKAAVAGEVISKIRGEFGFDWEGERA